MIMKKYRELIEATKTVECRKVTVVGIFGRTDITKFVESKIISINEKLEALCRELGVEFLAPAEFYKKIGDARKWDTQFITRSMVDRRGLHLNEWGQREVGRWIFKHCNKFLN